MFNSTAQYCSSQVWHSEACTRGVALEEQADLILAQLVKQSGLVFEAAARMGGGTGEDHDEVEEGMHVYVFAWVEFCFGCCVV